MLKQIGIPFQFVGNSAEPWNGLWKVPTNQPASDLRQAGQDRHEGHGAKDTAFVARNIASWVQTNEPDFILLMIGINDMRAGAAKAPASAKANLRQIVQTVVDLRPETRVIVAQTIPSTRPTPAILDLNRFIRDSLAPEFAKRGAKVTTVDQFANFAAETGGAAGDPSLYSNGYNHPNAEGYRRMAKTWCGEIERLLRNDQRDSRNPRRNHSYLSHDQRGFNRSQ